MKIVIKILCICFLLAGYSCSNDDDSPTASNNIFNGNWNGTFSGDNSGTWSVLISTEGNITGTANGADLKGTVSDTGDFSATIGNVSGGTTFIGKLNGNTGSGTWGNKSLNETGTWEGSRQ